MAKDKKKNKGKAKSSGGSGATASLKSLAQNPLIADVVAAALVSTAAALKDSKKARQLAEQAGDELETLAKEGAERGSAMWQLALDVGRRALDSFAGDSVKPAKASRSSSAKPSKSVKAKSPKKTKRTKG